MNPTHSSQADTPRALLASLTLGAEGQPTGFQLSLGSETTTLEPGKTWNQIDHFKWVTRGVIEPPQSFAVHPDGSVDLNGQTFKPNVPSDVEALAVALNKHHTLAPTPRKPPSTPTASADTASRKVQFRTHLDAVSHLVVEASRGSERTETGMRGLAHLVTDGWMRRPGHIHVDPLQRYVEIDEHRFDSSAEGAEQLQIFLNEHYVPDAATETDIAIGIRENLGASTGFDIHFSIVRAGTRFEIKGHLSQDKLDILQDTEKCGLLQRGTILRISPPFLYFRRRSADGGEEHIPGIPDVKYRAVSAPELQQLLNHPLIRHGTPAPAPDLTLPPPDVEPTPNPQPPPPPIPPPPPPAKSDAPLPTAKAAHATPPVRTPPPAARPAPVEQPEDPLVAGLFAEKDPHHINDAIFRQLADRLHTAPQDVLLSLRHVFEDREFEILDFSGSEITSVLQLRTGDFYGVYLTHLGPGRIDLVYACHGVHIEWGTDKCALQPGPGAETIELKGHALRGLAQNQDNHFIFIVEPRYRAFIAAHERSCAEAFAHFLTIHEWAERRTEFPLIWPVAT